ncbi:MAG TPA: hypothetical protein VGT41_04810 [Candidatus Babeliales bacterium]|nr:hypothetical protein [Candidatus Babeliales bacterium]
MNIFKQIVLLNILFITAVPGFVIAADDSAFESLAPDALSDEQAASEFIDYLNKQLLPAITLGYRLNNALAESRRNLNETDQEISRLLSAGQAVTAELEQGRRLQEIVIESCFDSYSSQAPALSEILGQYQTAMGLMQKLPGISKALRVSEKKLNVISLQAGQMGKCLAGFEAVRQQGVAFLVRRPEANRPQQLPAPMQLENNK